jgi:hypothetical protein
MNNVIHRSIAAAALVGLSAMARAGIVTTTGAVEFVANPPSDVSSNQRESNTIIRAFNEQQNLTLPQALSVDITVPGTSPNAISANLSPGAIPAGTVVSSYALHYDVVGTRATNNALEALGSITFSDNILGVIVLSDSLNATNSVLGLSNLTYSNGPDHGLELTPGGGGTSDVITLGPDDRTLTLDLHNASFADDVRVVTAVDSGSTGSGTGSGTGTTAVPLPAAFGPGAMVMATMIGLALYARRRTKSSRRA